MVSLLSHREPLQPQPRIYFEFEPESITFEIASSKITTLYLRGMVAYKRLGLPNSLRTRGLLLSELARIVLAASWELGSERCQF